MTDEAARRQQDLHEADRNLDRAWRSGVGVEEALVRAKWLSSQVGRDPVIEDAKVAVAREFDCDPSAAFAVLQAVSQHTNRRLQLVAHDVVDRASAAASAS